MIPRQKDFLKRQRTLLKKIYVLSMTKDMKRFLKRQKTFYAAWRIYLQGKSGIVLERSDWNSATSGWVRTPIN